MRWLAALLFVAPFAAATIDRLPVDQHVVVPPKAAEPAAAAVSAFLPYSLGLVRQPFFNGLVVDGIDVLSQLVSTIEIPEIKEHISNVAVLGAVDLTLNEIRFVRLDADSSSSSIQIRDGYVQGTVLGLSLEIRLHWHYRKSHWPNISGSGHAKVTTKNGRIELGLAVGFDSRGLVNLNLFNTYVDLNNFDITVTDGNASWLYNILFDMFNGALKGAVTDAVRNVINNELPKTLNKVFQKQPLDVPLFGNQVHLNTAFYGWGPSVVANPGLVVASNRLEFSNKYYQNCPYEPNLDPSFPPNDYEPNSAFLAFADLATVKCFAWSLRTSNAFSYRLNADMLPDGISVLSVEAWEDVFPSINERYRGDNFFLIVTLATDPDLSTNWATGVSAKISLNVDWYVAGNWWHPDTYVLSTEITLEGSAWFGIWQHWWYSYLHLDVWLNYDSVRASGRIVRVDDSIPRDGIKDALFDETMGELSPVIAYIAGSRLKGFDIINIPYARLVNAKVIYDEARNAIGVASDLRVVSW